jgi:hypothetical protein
MRVGFFAYRKDPVIMDLVDRIHRARV